MTPSSQSPFSTLSPLDGTPLESVTATRADDIPALVARARNAQAEWAQRPIADRIEAVFAVKSRILDRGDELAALLRKEIGKPHAETWTAEVVSNADLIDHWVEDIEPALAPEEVTLDPVAYPGKSGSIQAAARGVVALITPWNFPVAIPLRAIVPALLAGNAVVFKPSEHSPRAGAFVARLFDGLLPEGVLTLVQGGGDVGAALVRAGVDVVVFTGSVATGRRIALAAAEALIPVSLELGGKDAAIVLADADVERTARGLVWGAFSNAGQNCASIERVYVERAIARPVIDRVVELTRALRPGEDVGPLTTASQLETVRAHVTGAVEAGAKLLCGGAPTGVGLGYAPTVLEVDGAAETTPLMRDETFGPVLPIAVVDSVEEALVRANDSRYGLTASIWTRHPDRAARIAERLRAGVVTFNNHGFTGAIAAAPWTGVGESGYGVTNSRHALRELTRPRFVLVDRSRAKSELWWMPYTPSLVATAKALAALRSQGRNVGQKIVALGSLLANAPRRLMGN